MIGAQFYSVFGLVHAPWLDQTSVGQRSHIDDRNRPKRKAFPQTVGFVGYDTRNLERRLAKSHRAAVRNVQPLAKRWPDIDFALCRGFGNRSILQLQRAVMWVSAVDRLQFGKQAVIADGHCAQPDGFGQTACLAQGRQFGPGCSALGNGDLNIAAEYRLPAPRQFFADTGSQAANRRQCCDAEKQTDGEQTQSPDPRRKVTA